MKQEKNSIASFLIATVIATVVVTVFGLIKHVILPFAKWLSARVAHLTLSAVGVIGNYLTKFLKKKQPVEIKAQVLPTPSCFVGAANLAKAKELDLKEI